VSPCSVGGSPRLLRSRSQICTGCSSEEGRRGLWGGQRGFPTAGHRTHSSAWLSSPSSSSPGCCRCHQVPRGHVLAPRHDTEPLAIIFGSPGPPSLPLTVRPPGTAERDVHRRQRQPLCPSPEETWGCREVVSWSVVPKEPPRCQLAWGQVGGVLGVRLAWTAGRGICSSCLPAGAALGERRTPRAPCADALVSQRSEKGLFWVETGQSPPWMVLPPYAGLGCSISAPWAPLPLPLP